MEETTTPEIITTPPETGVDSTVQLFTETYTETTTIETIPILHRPLGECTDKEILSFLFVCVALCAVFIELFRKGWN